MNSNELMPKPATILDGYSSYWSWANGWGRIGAPVHSAVPGSQSHSKIRRVVASAAQPCVTTVSEAGDVDNRPTSRCTALRNTSSRELERATGAAPLRRGNAA